MYYLPIKISERRIHVCEMKPEATDPVFGFLFTGTTLFQTSPYGDNELIAFHGENIELKDYHFELKSGENDIDGKKVYDFYIVKNSDSDENNDDENGLHKIDTDVPFAIDTNENSFYTGGVKILFKMKGSKRVLTDDFIIKIHYEEENEDFCYAFKGYPAESGYGGNITDAAMDFGSEASQIKIGTARVNINQVFSDNFYTKTPKWHRVSGNPVDVNKELWQSDPKHPDLYRSAYFIHKTPKETKFGDKPNNNGEKTYVQALMPLTTEKNYYKELLLLPNLKLLDLMSDANKVMLERINVTTGGLLEGSNASNLSDNQFRQNTLRLILSNLMHCVIASANAKITGKKRYLRLVMLMPNVYDQKKVYDIVEGLYKDFDTITKADADNRKFDGLEVAVISESDASFLGVLQKHNNLIKSIPDAPNQFYLIIDAGKGTTDFSVMHTSDGNINVWNSLFRGGLPASGHAMTYAIYDAIWAFFKRKKEIDIDTMLRDKETDRSTVRAFMDCLETLKANYSVYEQKKDADIKLADQCNNLSDVNEQIEQIIIGNGFLVEGTREIMQKKVDEMSQLIVKGIKNYMDSAHKGQKFGKVLLTGRAFMLKEFYDELVKTLTEEDMVSDDCINVLPPEELKRICLDGSTSIGNNYYINNNSELICRPTVKNTWTDNDLLSKLVRWLKKLGKKANAVRVNDNADDAFYYNGIEVEDPKNAELTMGLGSNWIYDAKHIYYVGRGLLVKRNNNDNRIDELTPQKNDNVEDCRLIEKLTNESLFPYYPSSIPAQGTHKPLYVPGSNNHSEMMGNGNVSENTTNDGKRVEGGLERRNTSDDNMNFDNL